MHVDARDARGVALLHARLGIALSLHHSALDVPRALEHLDAAERLQGVESYQVHTGRAQAAMFGVRTALLESSSDAVRATAERDGRPDLVVAAGWAKALGALQPRAPGRVRRGGPGGDVAGRPRPRELVPRCGAPRRLLRCGPRSTCSTRRPHVPGAGARSAMPRFASLRHSHETVADQLGLAMLMAGDTAAAREVLAVPARDGVQPEAADAAGRRLGGRRGGLGHGHGRGRVRR